MHREEAQKIEAMVWMGPRIVWSFDSATIIDGERQMGMPPIQGLGSPVHYSQAVGLGCIIQAFQAALEEDMRAGKCFLKRSGTGD